MSEFANEDEYYFDENGLLVFTESYHKKRGFCCKCGCRHCPYGFDEETKQDKTNRVEKVK